MTVPSFTAEQSLYRSHRHYRASAPASSVGGIRPSDALPAGTYQQSCFNCSYDGDALACFCYDVFGGYSWSRLHGVPYCSGDIYNTNSVLGCVPDCGFVVDLSLSSQRYKEDIANLGEEAGEAVLQLRPVTFRYKQMTNDGTRARRYGLIAEEVAETLPEVVVRGPDGRVEGIDYHQFPALLLSALQREHAVIEAQDHRVQALESQLTAPEAGRPSAWAQAVAQRNTYP
jgi:hypothetical protein